ncbi:MAG: hypothetical protein PHQ04_07880 [Opitutaceae bacterium]|nr:hypothetical protein [Opitutaceae bacterium]
MKDIQELQRLATPAPKPQSLAREGDDFLDGLTGDTAHQCDQSGDLDRRL